MQVNLFKRKTSYVNQDGEPKTATNFFVCCGDILVPIEVKYFENKETHRDDRYGERKSLLSAFAETLPDRPKTETTGQPVTPVNPPIATKATREKTSDNVDVPF